MTRVWKEIFLSVDIFDLEKGWQSQRTRIRIDCLSGRETRMQLILILFQIIPLQSIDSKHGEANAPRITISMF